MKRDEVLKILRAHRGVLAERFGVVELALSGSFARDEAGEKSDVDILARFSEPPDYHRYFGAGFYMEDLPERPADLATDHELRSEIRPCVEREIVHV